MYLTYTKTNACKKYVATTEDFLKTAMLMHISERMNAECKTYLL